MREVPSATSKRILDYFKRFEHWKDTGVLNTPGGVMAQLAADESQLNAAIKKLSGAAGLYPFPFDLEEWRHNPTARLALWLNIEKAQ